jgi:16S rRNA (uracil1498-N3)-methyltransferase
VIDRRHEPLVFVADIAVPELDDQTESHLTRSLRLKPGDLFNVSDGAGNWRAVRLAPHGVEIVGDVVAEPRAGSQTAVAFTPVKGDRSPWVVQKLTELNVGQIIVIQTERSVVRWDEARLVKQLSKLRRVAAEACGQSRRVWFPELTARTLSEVLAMPGACLADPDGRPIGVGDRVVAIGPEGGWSQAEATLADHIVLPGAVLRAETAAIAAGVLLGINP